MTPKLSPAIAQVLAPLLGALPMERAMTSLVVTRPGDAGAAAAVEGILKNSVLAGKPALAAGLWLYVDDLDKSHTISQGIDDATGAYWHGIMHRREGDFSNSHYWFRRVGKHPAAALVGAGYEPHEFIDAVERGQGKAAVELIEMQRREWVALFEWCAGVAGRRPGG